MSSASIDIPVVAAAAAAAAASGDDKPNFLRQFRDASSGGFYPITASQFRDVWNHFDLDGNGFIEENELDSFLRELVSSINSSKVGPEVISDAAFALMKSTFMSAYDDNEDNRIDISELAGILPLEENFLLFFQRDHPLESSQDFMKIWKQFDKDCNGFIEPDELKVFLRHLLNEATPVKTASDDQIQEYTEVLMQLFDKNCDQKLHLSEMAKLLRVRENYLRKPIFKNSLQRLTRREMNRIFDKYDQDRNGSIEKDELSGLIKDLLDCIREDYTIEDVEYVTYEILQTWDLDKDGTICRAELAMLLENESRLGSNTGAR